MEAEDIRARSFEQVESIQAAWAVEQANLERKKLALVDEREHWREQIKQE